MNNLNDVNNLYPHLKQKFDEYISNPRSKANDYFSYKEFEEVFSATTFQWMFIYHEIIFGLTNFGDNKIGGNMRCEFFNESSNDETQLFESTEKLFEMVRVDKKTLKEIWLEVHDC